MQEFFDAISVYTFGAGGTMPDGSIAPDALPDGTLPTYSNEPAGIHGAPTTGLLQEVAFPAEPFGFGCDLSCTEDFTPNFDEVDPDSALGVAQAAWRRLNTPRGIIPDAPGDGIDIRSYLQRALNKAGQLEVPSQLKQELLKDDRIEPRSLVVKMNITEPNAVEFDIRGNTARGPFSLVLNASDSAVLFKAITGDA